MQDHQQLAVGVADGCTPYSPADDEKLFLGASSEGHDALRSGGAPLDIEMSAVHSMSSPTEFDSDGGAPLLETATVGLGVPSGGLCAEGISASSTRTRQRRPIRSAHMATAYFVLAFGVTVGILGTASTVYEITQAV